jgi:hypothetical protein
MAKAKTKPRAKAKPKRKLPPFPFFGAGDAHYFEWFEMWVWFAQPVPKSKRAALVKLAPKLCQLDAQWPADHLLWASTGDQWIQRHLVEAYGTAKAKKRMRDYQKKLDEDEDADPWGGDSDELLAMGDEEKTFNTEIEAWLPKAHAKQAILFVARREDGEAGGTKLSAWHKASLAHWPAVETAIHAALAKKPLKGEDDKRSAPIAIAAGYLGDKISPATRALVGSDASADSVDVDLGDD